ncbi:ribonuclease H-like domain-containing protein, partial [Tanacetum coccineum]
MDFKEKRHVSLDKSKIECYNCHRKGHFARECRSERSQGRRYYGDNGRSNAPINESSSQALVAQEGLGGYDCSNDFEVEPVNYDLMAISSSSSSSSSVSEVQKCSKQCLESFKCLQKNYDTEREKHNKAKLEIRGYEIALESLESRILRHEKNELAWGKKYEFQNYELKCREIKVNNLTLELEKVVKERDESSDEDSTPTNVRSSQVEGFKSVPPPIIGNFLTIRADISFAGLDEYAIRNKIIELQTTALNTKTSETTGQTNAEKPKSVSESVLSNPKFDRDRVIIEDWNSDDEKEDTARPSISTVRPSVSTARPVCTARPSISTARLSVSTARPVCTARPSVGTARPIYASRPIYPRMDNVRPRGSCSPIKRSYYTKPAFRPKDLKQDVKTFGVQNMTTAGTRAVVNT